MMTNLTKISIGLIFQAQFQTNISTHSVSKSTLWGRPLIPKTGHTARSGRAWIWFKLTWLLKTSIYLNVRGRLSFWEWMNTNQTPKDQGVNQMAVVDLGWGDYSCLLPRAPWNNSLGGSMLGDLNCIGRAMGKTDSLLPVRELFFAETMGSQNIHFWPPSGHFVFLWFSREKH